jgi:hypothetical protein
MHPSVSPGEDRDELSYFGALVSIERVPGSLVDQVLRLALELLGELLPEPREGVPDRLFQRTDAFLGHARSPLSLGKGCVCTCQLLVVQIDSSAGAI